VFKPFPALTKVLPSNSAFHLSFQQIIQQKLISIAWFRVERSSPSINQKITIRRFFPTNYLNKFHSWHLMHCQNPNWYFQFFFGQKTFRRLKNPFPSWWRLWFSPISFAEICNELEQSSRVFYFLWFGIADNSYNKLSFPFHWKTDIKIEFYCRSYICDFRRVLCKL
jgi:hypothetical protein